MSGPAVFIDRAGVLNALVLQRDTGEYESPRRPEELSMLPGSVEALRRLQDSGYALYLVSNQPNCAKGKATLAELEAVHAEFEARLREGGVSFRGFFYCYHHPRGVVPEYSKECLCRKPKPHFVREACRRDRLDPARCWMVGDQDADLECGRLAGCRTGLVDYPPSASKRGGVPADARAKTLHELVALILAADGRR